MKIKNISNQDLNIPVQLGKEVKNVVLKPNQVVYCESTSQITKQFLIYEKKKLISTQKQSEKPDYVEYYKSFFESGTYSSIKREQPINLVEDEEDDVEIPEIQDQILEQDDFEETSFEETQDSKEQTLKKGRGRPKKPVVETDESLEKKKRGRPKGTTKIKQNDTTI